MVANSSTKADGVSMISRRGFLVAGPMIFAPSLSWAGEAASGWRMWIEQAGHRLEITPNVRLKRQPFTFVFQGPRDWAYTVLACEDQADVAGKDALAFLNTSTNALMVFAESSDPADNNYLCVNGVGVIATYNFGMHGWVDDPDFDEHDFTRFTTESTSIAKAERDVQSLLLIQADGTKEEVAVASTTIATISLIVAANKPMGYLNFVAPLSFTIVFE